MKFNLSIAAIRDLTQVEPGIITPLLEVNGQTVFIKDIITRTLLMGHPSDLPAVKKQKYNIATLIQRDDTPELSAEDITCITEAVGQATAPMIYGQVCDFFNNSDNVVK